MRSGSYGNLPMTISNQNIECKPLVACDNNESRLYAFGNGLFSRYDLKRIKACRGRCKGTSWPAPVTVTRVNPLYIWLHPPTY